MNRTLRIALSLGSASVLLAACGSGSSTSSAKSLLSRSQAAVGKASSVTFTDTTSIGKNSEVISGQVGAAAANEKLAINGKVQLQLIYVNNVAYINTSSLKVLQSSLNLSSAGAASAAGKWISISSTDAAFQSVVQSLSIAAAVGVYFPQASTAKVGNDTSFGGATVTPISSTTKTSSGVTQATTLYLNTKTQLPAGGHLKASAGGTSETKKAVFTEWDRPVVVSAPAGASPISSFPSAG